MNKIEFKPYSAQFAANPYPVYAALRQHSPIFYDDDWGVTFATTHEDVSALLVHKSLGRSMDHILPPEALARRCSPDNSLRQGTTSSNGNLPPRYRAVRRPARRARDDGARGNWACAT